MAAKPSMPIWILIVDDEPIVLSSLRKYFNATEDVRVAAEAHDGIEALSVLSTVSVDVVLADMHMPKMDGITLLREVKKKPDPPPFIAMAVLDVDDDVLDVLAAGGAGYLAKSASPQTIMAAIRSAVVGGVTISPRYLECLINHISSRSKSHNPTSNNVYYLSYDSLTNVERIVLGHLCEGKSNAEIAKAINYSESTVKKLVSNLMSIFNSKSRLELVVRILRADRAEH